MASIVPVPTKVGTYQQVMAARSIVSAKVGAYQSGS